MQQLASDVHRLALTPRDGINVYVLGDVLVDAGIRLSGGSILKAVRDRGIRAHAITHAHVDHVGATREVAGKLDIPLWAGERDAHDVESGVPEPPAHAPGPKRIARMLGSFPGHPVARRLKEGDELTAGFVVLDTPGHSNGHVSFWRESDRILVCGDVVFNMNIVTTQPGLHEPVRAFTTDPQRNRASIRRIAELEPSLVLVGHGPPIQDAAPKLRSFADSLPA
jgi:glyoxylase-like metal-dependent hydrolase (beta-lactamase superfamily II)